MKETLPPSAPEVEDSVLCSASIDEEARRIICEALEPKAFYLKAHQVYYGHIRKLHAEGKPFDLPVFVSSLSEEDRKHLTAVKVSAIRDCPPAVDVSGSVALLKEFAARRRIIEELNAASKAVGDLSRPINDIGDMGRRITEATLIEAKAAVRFPFVHNSDLLKQLKPIEWRIHDILVDNAFYYNFGDSGHFKTFVELDRCLCIASGIPYHGHRVKQGTVFYICAKVSKVSGGASHLGTLLIRPRRQRFPSSSAKPQLSSWTQAHWTMCAKPLTA